VLSVFHQSVVVQSAMPIGHSARFQISSFDRIATNARRNEGFWRRKPVARRLRNLEVGGVRSHSGDQFNDPPPCDAMTSIEFNELPTLRRIAGRVVYWGTVDMVLGAVCGGIFGAVFGGLGYLVQFNASPILFIVGYFSLCGAAAGALVGTCGVVIDDTDVIEPARPPQRTPNRRDQKIGIDEEPGPAAPRPPQVRAVFDLTSVRRPREVAASQKPSWN